MNSRLGTWLFGFRFGAEWGTVAFGEFQGLADRGGEEVEVAGGGVCSAGFEVGGVQGLPTLVSGLQVVVGLGVVRMDASSRRVLRRERSL